MKRALTMVAVATLAATQAPAQSIADRIAAVRSGTVALRFRTRPGVCGGADGGVQTIGRDRDAGNWFSREPCVVGPAVVTIGRDGNDVVSIRLRIGLRGSDQSVATDLGDVPSADAAQYLARLAHHMSGRNAEAALTAAVIADGYDVWPDFRQIVLDADAPNTAREQALFWIGQSDTPTSNVVSLYPELSSASLREHYTFTLSQRRDDDEAIDKLIDVAKHDRDADVRKQAMFWLGQSRNAKATRFFREVLTP
jgi:hypothetical protein